MLPRRSTCDLKTATNKLTKADIDLLNAMYSCKTGSSLPLQDPLLPNLVQMLLLMANGEFGLAGPNVTQSVVQAERGGTGCVTNLNLQMEERNVQEINGRRITA